MEERSMTTSAEYNRPDTAEREIRVLADARIRPMMGIEVLESLPHARIPYELVDPFILVHEAVVPITPERASLDTEHPPQHRSRRRDRARAASDRIALEDPNGPRRPACGGHRRGRSPRGQVRRD